MATEQPVENVTVLVPTNPFVLHKKEQVCLCALDVEKLMRWWPGLPHFPHRNPAKVRAIQRSLDWKRVAHIAAYLLQEELEDTSDLIERYFTEIYEPSSSEPGRQWPPKVNRVIGYTRSIYPSFSNILVHVNGAALKEDDKRPGSGTLVLDPSSEDLSVTVVDGQHRVNGAYLALMIRRETQTAARFELPSQVFIDLDPPKSPPRKQAQIFIDVNFYQKKVDRSLVADLFPTAREKSTALDDKERAQDIGRKLMLETGPLVGMIQIPGIRYGVKDVIALATLNGAIEDVLPSLRNADLTSLEEQVDFISQALSAWLAATGRQEEPTNDNKLSSENVVYQGRILVSVIDLLPAMIWRLRKLKAPLISPTAESRLAAWLQQVIETAGLVDKNGKFMSKDDFKKGGYLGSGGIGRFRNRLWASIKTTDHQVSRMGEEKVLALSQENKKMVNGKIGGE